MVPVCLCHPDTGKPLKRQSPVGGVLLVIVLTDYLNGMEVQQIYSDN